jgi:hypothetical protein
MSKSLNQLTAAAQEAFYAYEENPTPSNLAAMNATGADAQDAHHRAERAAEHEAQAARDAASDRAAWYDMNR